MSFSCILSLDLLFYCFLNLYFQEISFELSLSLYSFSIALLLQLCPKAEANALYFRTGCYR